MVTLKKYKLSEVATFEISNIDKKTKAGELSVHLCNFTDVYYNWAVTEAMEDSFMVATASDNQIKKLLLRKGQVAITKDSETRHDIGIPTYIANDFDSTVLGYHCALITPNPEMLDGRYLNAYLNSSLAKEYFANNASGSGMRYSLPVDAIKNILLYLPSIEVQREIGKIFSAIDRKIALNREINRNLEAMARQLYDYWFVQFDFPDENGRPYKSSGGKMVWNEKLKRSIPSTWRNGSLPEIANFSNGIACQKFRPTNESDRLPVIKIREMRDGITDESEWVRSDIPESVKVYNGDILFSWSASLEVMIWCGGKGGLNQHIFKVTPQTNYPKSFIYYQILDYIEVFKSIAEARKTTMGHITQDHLNQSAIAIPEDNYILQLFNDKILPIFQDIVSNNEEINSLTLQRDELLPLLMNGQVYVMPTDRKSVV